MTEVIDLAIKNVKTTIINMFYVFKRIEKYMNMIKREMEDFYNDQMESPQMKNTIHEIKNRVGRINIVLDTSKGKIS